MSNAADLTTGIIGGNFTYGGLGNNSYVYLNDSYQGNAFQTYGGTANTQDVQVANNINGAVSGIPYGSYAATYNGTLATNLSTKNDPTIPLVDNERTYPWPKDQQIYYKLVGFNTQNQQFETWIIAEEIVPRTEIFDPTQDFPNIDYNVFFTPPSGNQLVNIKIVGRWIQ